MRQSAIDPCIPEGAKVIGFRGVGRIMKVRSTGTMFRRIHEHRLPAPFYFTTVLTCNAKSPLWLEVEVLELRDLWIKEINGLVPDGSTVKRCQEFDLARGVHREVKKVKRITKLDPVIKAEREAARAALRARLRIEKAKEELARAEAQAVKLEGTK